MIIITVGCCRGSSGDCRAPSQLWSLPVLVHVEGGRKDDDHDHDDDPISCLNVITIFQVDTLIILIYVMILIVDHLNHLENHHLPGGHNVFWLFRPERLLLCSLDRRQPRTEESF